MNIKDIDIIKYAPVGFALQKLIVNESGEPVDIEFIELNEMFEELTFVKRTAILGKKITEVYPNAVTGEINWVKVCAETALNGTVQEFERFSAENEKYYHLKLISPEKFYFVSFLTDITCKKTSEQKFKAERERLEFAIDAGDIGIWDWNVGTSEVYYSDRYNTMIGYNPGEIPGTLEAWANMIHPDDRQDTIAYVNSFKPTDLQYHLKFRLLCKDGSYKWISGHGKFYGHDENRDPARAVGIHIDIDKLERARNLLKEREEQFRRIFYLSPQPMSLTEATTNRVVDVNDIFCNKTRVTKNQLIGKSMVDLGLITDYDDEKCRDSLIEHGQITGLEQKMYTVDGDVMIVRIYSTLFVRDKSQYILTLYFDLTNEIETQREISRFKIIADAASHGMVIINTDGFIHYINSYFAQIHGYTKEELIGENIVVFHSPEQIADVREIFRKVQEDQNITGFELWHKHRDGSVFPMLMSANFMVDDITGEKYIAASAVDISESKKNESEILRAKQQAENANKSKSQFLANMSHEIRTPLNAVIGFSELLKKTQLSTIQKQYVQTVSTSAHSLLEVINDILDFSKIEAGKLELQPVKTDILELIEQCSDLITFNAEQKGLELLLDIDPELPKFAVVDPIRLKQILVNLLGNAVKFTEAGEVALVVTCQQLERNNGKITFSVTDTGIGISENQQENLFKAFSQADNSTTRKYGGTGLGLIISDLLARKMGSSIKLKSKPGEGSTFQFSIETEVSEVVNKNKSSLLHVSRCLIVDDNKKNSSILQKILSHWDIESTLCDTGSGALKILSADTKYDIILIDYHMPDMNGIETIRQLRELPDFSADRQSVFLLYSSTDGGLVHQVCNELGISCAITKPVKSGQLYECLRNEQLGISSCDDIKHDELADTITEKKEINSTNLKILLAEDNPANMLLARLLVNQILPDSEVYEAYNGNDAVELAEENVPEIILMDVHMPGMDGNMATEIIRKSKNTKLKNSLIIGLTAGAMKSEEEKSLAAGMDIFVTKPIEVEKLKTILNDHIKKNKTQGKTKMYDVNTEKLNHFDKDSFITRLGFNISIGNRLIDITLSNLPVQLEELKKAVSGNEALSIADAAHTVKGSTLNTELQIMTQIAKKMEEDAKQGNTFDSQKDYTRLMEEWEIAKKYLLDFTIE
jgi:PAS domain S-box-containing protein